MQMNGMPHMIEQERILDDMRMKSMKKEEIIRFLKDNVEPLEDIAYGNGYRASVQLVDGVFLPCVIFRDPKTIVDLAIRRLKEERFNRELTSIFVAKGNCVNDHDIASIDISKYAFPLSVLKQVRGETTMSWTAFAAKMKDGKHYGFGTTFLIDFFQMPEGYAVEDIVEIINHTYVLKNGELRPHGTFPTILSDEKNGAVIYRERPYFECFIDGL